MQETTNYKLKKPESNEFISVDDLNYNADVLDKELKKLEENKVSTSGGDISETVITTTEESTAEYPVPAAGDSAKTVLGKVQKFFGDIRNWMTGVCLLGQIVNNCVTNNAKLPLAAAQGKALMDKLTTLNSDKLTKGSLFTVIIPITYSVPADSTVDINVPCSRDGYAALGAVGLSGLTANCIARQYHINDGQVYISIYNKSSSTQTGTGTIRILYRAE